MKVKELRELLAGVPDNAEVGYQDPNFGGLWKQHPLAIEIKTSFDTQLVLVEVPYWREVD